MRAFCFGQFLADLGRFLADYWQILVDFRHISFTRAAAGIYNIWIKHLCKNHEKLSQEPPKKHEKSLKMRFGRRAGFWGAYLEHRLLLFS